jgi:hypothetical protein
VSTHLYGLLAEFESPQALLAATRAAFAEGYRNLDAYSPFPVDGLAEAMGFEKTRVAPVTLLGGIAGGAAGYGMQFYSATLDYPLNSGGRPLHSWPSFIPITFELTILGAALAAVFGMLWMNGLPKPYHPVFNVPAFKRASECRFFLCLMEADVQFDKKETRRFLESMTPISVEEVEE